MLKTAERLDLVDCLRGFAIVAIMLVHNIEHFELPFSPEGTPAWLAALDTAISDSVFFLFSGKAYAIFAMLFGVTFYLQLSRRAQRGEDFRGRFAWRLVLLLGFGLVNSAIYAGDILCYYAVLGFVLIPLAHLPTRAVLALAIVCMLQPYAWWQLMGALADPGAVPPKSMGSFYYEQSVATLKGDSMLASLVSNFTSGRMSAVLWSWNNGRFFQIISLFMLGMLAGRCGLFDGSPTARRFWTRTLVLAAIAFIPLYLLRMHMNELVEAAALRRPVKTIVVSWVNLSFMLVLVSGFVLLFQGAGRRVLGAFGALGRMSLTSYMMQSLAGALLYHGYGLGLYASTGATVCLLIGIALALAQGMFSAWWLRRHAQGPLEALWHRATWCGRRDGAAVARERAAVP